MSSSQTHPSTQPYFTAQPNQLSNSTPLPTMQDPNPNPTSPTLSPRPRLTFTPSFIIPTITSSFLPYMERMIAQNLVWKLGLQDQESVDTWLDVFKNLVEYNYPELQILQSPMFKFHKTLIYPNFTTLRYLNLTNNNITNIQFLSLINAPALSQLHLQFNFITNIKSLTKTAFDLDWLSLYQNLITEIGGLARMKSPEVDGWWQVMQSTAYTESRPGFNIDTQSPSFVVKLQKKDLCQDQCFIGQFEDKFQVRLDPITKIPIKIKVQKLWYEKQNCLIKQNRLVEVISRKYPQIRKR